MQYNPHNPYHGKHNDIIDTTADLERVIKDMSHFILDIRKGVQQIKPCHIQNLSLDVQKEIEESYQKQKILENEVSEKPASPQSPAKKRVKSPKPSQNSNTRSQSNENSGAKKTSNANNLGTTSTHLIASGGTKFALETNPLNILKTEVERAKRERKTFTIRGQFPAVRRALIRRGWVEKLYPGYRESLNDEVKKFQKYTIQELVDLLKDKSVTDICKRIIKSKLLKDHQIDLYWDHTFDAFKECPDSRKFTLINRFRREPFSYTSKQGLCQAVREAHWLQIPGVAQINHPRSYVLTKEGDVNGFVQDFGITAAVSLLKWIVHNNITGECRIASTSGKVPMKFFDFAVTECYKYIKRCKHEDIDEEIKEASQQSWNEFLEYFYKAVHVGNHFKTEDKEIDPNIVTSDMVRKSNYLLNELRNHMSSMDMDGYMNIWILKPTNGSRGIGIHICRTVKYVLDIAKKNPNTRYIIQKYVEKPLLIHDTKFDIRQWFLVTSSCPLTIWFYKQCYLRFSSQTYNLRKLHESIHITNNSVQCKYANSGNKDPLLPSYNMWDSKQFKQYLSDIGYPNVYDEVIYQAMKQCIIAAMISHQDKIDKRPNCFELYGADFIVAENFQTWLLEINSSPALHASTPVTARMCPQVLEDVIRVVVDYARSKNSNTGNFELIYKDKAFCRKKDTNDDFLLTGYPLSQDYFYDPPILQQETKKTKDVVKTPNLPDPSLLLMQTGENLRMTLAKLLKIIKQEKERRKRIKDMSVEVRFSCVHSTTQTTENRPLLKT